MSDFGKSSVATDGPGYVQLTVTLKVNGQEHEVSIDPRMTLLDCLREVLHLTGTCLLYTSLSTWPPALRTPRRSGQCLD